MVLRFAGFEFDRPRAELRGPDGKAVKLRAKPFEMLGLFAANAGRVISKQELMETVWPKVHVAEDSLFQCIRELRVALGDSEHALIKVVSGRGYLFDAEVTAAEPARDKPAAPEATETEQTTETPRASHWRKPSVLAGLAALIILAVAAPMFGSRLFTKTPTMIAVMPLTVAGGDRDATAMAAGVTARLTDGLAKIENIRVVAPPKDAASPARTTFVVSGELQNGDRTWTLQARMTRAADNSVQPVTSITVDDKDADISLQQTRLAAGIGHQLALRINEMTQPASSAVADINASQGAGKVAIEQAIASITRTTRERFADAQTMLQKALASNPDNVDLSVALAALQLRGIQMVWYGPDDARAAEDNARAILERAVKARPDSIPVLETHCRFLSTTNSFVASVVACARVLSLDPWNGGTLYLVGLGQIHLGRFEDALATFKQADRFDTPQVSRWTWMVGAGWANLLLGRDADAVPWLQRSIAITPATGRTHMLLAAAYQRLDRTEEASAAMRKGLKLRPGTTAQNVQPPTKNASPVYLEASVGIIRAMVAAGLPER